MAEQKKPVETATAAPGEQRAVSRPPLVRASESGDPVVHKALGDLETARLNLDAARREGVADPDAEASAAAAADVLKGLGYR